MPTAAPQDARGDGSVRWAAHEQPSPDSELPAPREEAGKRDSAEAQNGAATKSGPPAKDDAPERLPPGLAAAQPATVSLEDVLNSVEDSYPLLEVAIGELNALDGKALAAWGNFDTRLSGDSISQPLGFYQNYQNRIALARPLYAGGEVYGAYRIGDGRFEPWFGERQTNEGGEFKLGWKQPFVKDRHIDDRRRRLWRAELERGRMEPDVMARVLEFMRMAAQDYWKWVAAGQIVKTQQQLLRLAEDRARNVQKRVEAGDLPMLAEIDNGRFITSRRAKVIAAERKLQEAAIKLSLFYRNANGQPIVLPSNQMPADFPPAGKLDPAVVEADVARALANRPEMRELAFQRRITLVDLDYARNLTMPKVDGFSVASQDVGGKASSLGDKSPFQLEAGVLAEVPLQRREGQGKIRAAQGKLQQIDAKMQFVEDKIRSQVQDAVSAVERAAEQIEQARDNVRLNRRSLQLGELSFNEGDIDMIELNIYETSLAEAELLLIDAEYTFFSALADYRTALGVLRPDTPAGTIGGGRPSPPPRGRAADDAAPRPELNDEERKPRQVDVP